MDVTLGSQEYTTPGSYTFDVPANVYWVWFTGVAGGGGGASTAQHPYIDAGGGGGGGAGECCEGVIIPTTPLGTLSVTVGAGGEKGHYNTKAYNFRMGPPDNEGAGNGTSIPYAENGNGGTDTVVGSIRLAKGWGGVQQGTANHGGAGGGWSARYGPYGGGQVSNGGLSISGTGSPGSDAVRKNSSRFYSGSGGGVGTNNTSGDTPGTDGGSFGPYPGGVGGSWTSIGGGGGGGASLFGPGGDGGVEQEDAPALVAGAYGAGGGGSGGNTVNGTAGEGTLGQNGGGGYVLLSWIQVIT